MTWEGEVHLSFCWNVGDCDNKVVSNKITWFLRYSFWKYDSFPYMAARVFYYIVTSLVVGNNVFSHVEGGLLLCFPTLLLIDFSFTIYFYLTFPFHFYYNERNNTDLSNLGFSICYNWRVSCFMKDAFIDFIYEELLA